MEEYVTSLNIKKDLYQVFVFRLQTFANKKYNHPFLITINKVKRLEYFKGQQNIRRGGHPYQHQTNWNTLAQTSG